MDCKTGISEGPTGLAARRGGPVEKGEESGQRLRVLQETLERARKNIGSRVRERE